MNIKLITRFLITLLCFSTSWSVFCEDRVVNLDMFVGEVKSLGDKEIKRIAVGAGKVLSAKVVKGGELLLIAEDKGSSSLKLWYKDGAKANYNIRVLAQDPEQRVVLKDMIRIKVRMIEFRKKRQSELGIDWASQASGPTFALLGDFKSNSHFRPPGSNLAGQGNNLPLKVGPFATYFGISTGITSRINFLKDTGDAVTIAEPVLSSVNGGRATFLSGGEIPYSTVGANGQVNVEFKQYGVKLDIFPRANKQGDIYTQVVSELSQPDGALIVGGIPALLTRRTDTQMNVRDGQTIVISGLLSAQSNKSNSAVPGLGRIPLLGRLFKSKGGEYDLRELVIFVTPEIVTAENIAGTAQEQKLLSNSHDQQRQMSEKLQYSMME